MADWFPAPTGNDILINVPIVTSLETDVVYIYDYEYYDSKEEICNCSCDYKKCGRVLM